MYFLCFPGEHCLSVGGNAKSLAFRRGRNEPHLAASGPTCLETGSEHSWGTCPMDYALHDQVWGCSLTQNPFVFKSPVGALLTQHINTECGP